MVNKKVDKKIDKPNQILTDQDIATLYKLGAQEQTSAELDQAILQQAADAIKADQINADNKVTPIKAKRFYNSWYGGISTAASICLVAVLFWQNNDWQDSIQELNTQQSELVFDQTQYPEQADMIEMETADVVGMEAKESNRQIAFQTETNSYIDNLRWLPPAIDFVSLYNQRYGFSVPICNEQLARDLSQVDELMALQESEQAKQKRQELFAQHPELKEILNGEYPVLLNENATNKDEIDKCPECYADAMNYCVMVISPIL